MSEWDPNSGDPEREPEEVRCDVSVCAGCCVCCVCSAYVYLCVSVLACLLCLHACICVCRYACRLYLCVLVVSVSEWRAPLLCCPVVSVLHVLE